MENSDGLVVSDGTWTYKIPTIDNIPKQFNIKLMKSGHHEKRVLSSKGSNVPLCTVTLLSVPTSMTEVFANFV